MICFICGTLFLLYATFVGFVVVWRKEYHLVGRIKHWRGFVGRASFVLLCWISLVGLGTGTVMAASGVEQRILPVDTDSGCAVAVDHGFTETTIRPDACVLAFLQGRFANQPLPLFRVVYKDSFDGMTLPSADATLSDQAQQAVRNAIEKHRGDFRWDYAACPNGNAKLTMQDHLVNLWGEIGNPSQFVIDNIPFVQFQTACSA